MKENSNAFQLPFKAFNSNPLKPIFIFLIGVLFVHVFLKASVMKQLKQFVSI